ncbi:pyridoxal phosphate-dependent transferase [Mycotypha africana]|uniref:pyridoxal phosphate-dependent transferase n=1 Tax=Mycotypha africana TaxID=64632 RepID=UPI002300EC77|nr:pyridoxal phosphate-dependent transferase [Mycotypha africana]KAI8979396.1 pyridoxal phosphate-dependent transferase [Mycotypha africana]
MVLLKRRSTFVSFTSLLSVEYAKVVRSCLFKSHRYSFSTKPTTTTTTTVVNRPPKYDLTSDTATQPTDEMFDIMKAASRGDDVFEDDTSVRELEFYVAKLLGKEAALFCASGTMTNQLGLRLLLTQPPHSVLCDARSHVYLYECGGIAYHSQASVSPVMPKNNHHLTVNDIASNLLTDPSHMPVTKVISLENTLNGTIMPLNEIKRIYAFAQQHQLKLHLDGARLWNASQETGIPLHEYGQYFDTISLCLSKGVGAPIGSILVSSKANIARARHLRKMLGGGWRQAGCLASAALHCIQHVVPTMKETHQLTRRLANVLVKQLGMQLSVPCETNMIWLNASGTTSTADSSSVCITLDELARELEKKSIRIPNCGDNTTETRLVLHYQITQSVVDAIVQATSDLMERKKGVIKGAIIFVAKDRDIDTAIGTESIENVSSRRSRRTV